VTKDGKRTRAFETGKPVTVEYLNDYVLKEDRVTTFTYKSDLTMQEAREKYPEWYESRIVRQEARKTWECKPDLYYWWLRTMKQGVTYHRRYFCVMCLAIYAKKSGISREQLEQDAFGLVDELDKLTQEETNHFTRSDVLKALEMYNDSYFTFPIDSIVELTAIPIQKNKRNFRKQKVHLQRMRAVQAIDYPDGEWRNKKGRPKGSGTKKELIEQWQAEHPEGKKADCIRATGADRKTVSKYWKK
jgi:hypothetical protein